MSNGSRGELVHCCRLSRNKFLREPLQTELRDLATTLSWRSRVGSGPGAIEKTLGEEGLFYWLPLVNDFRTEMVTFVNIENT
jgi:hypothetical protein